MLYKRKKKLTIESLAVYRGLPRGLCPSKNNLRFDLETWELRFAFDLVVSWIKSDWSLQFLNRLIVIGIWKLLFVFHFL